MINLLKKINFVKKTFNNKQNIIYLSIFFIVFGFFLGQYDEGNTGIPYQVGFGLGNYFVSFLGAVIATFLAMKFKFSFKNKLFYYLENIKSENLGFSFSLLLHLLLLLFAIGLPNFFDPQPISIPTIIPIEIINISEVTSIPKKINEIKPAEIQQKKVKEKKFNSSDIQEIQKVDIKEKPIIKIKKIEKNETPKQDIVIKEKKEIPIKLEKEKLKIDTNQVESLPTKKIKPKLKPKPNLLIEEIEKQPEVTVKAKLKPKPNPVIKKLEKKPDVEIKPKPKPKQDPEFIIQ